jgi:hypothetical protein
MVKKPWMEGRLEYTMLPDGTITGINFVECRRKIIIELPDTERTDRAIICMSAESTVLTRVKDSLVKDGSKLLCYKETIF